MKVTYIDPFIQSVQNLFSTTLGCETTYGDRELNKGQFYPRDVTVVIGLSGPASGTISLSFPVATALAMVRRLLGMEIRVMDDTVSQALGKMANMIAVSAKGKVYGTDGIPISLSLPNVIRGNSYSVDYPPNSVWLDVPFTSELGSFSLRMTVGGEGQTETDE